MQKKKNIFHSFLFCDRMEFEGCSMKQGIINGWKQLESDNQTYLKDSKGSFIKKVPNTLCYIRIFTSILIPVFTYTVPTIAFFLAALIALTDSFDGLIARKFDAASAYGAFLDTFADKFLFLMLVISLFKVSPFFSLLIIINEIIIAIINIFAGIYNKNPHSSILGKCKTFILCITSILGIGTLSILKIQTWMPYLFSFTILLQWITALDYIRAYFLTKKQY